MYQQKPPEYMRFVDLSTAVSAMITADESRFQVTFTCSARPGRRGRAGAVKGEGEAKDRIIAEEDQALFAAEAIIQQLKEALRAERMARYGQRSEKLSDLQLQLIDLEPWYRAMRSSGRSLAVRCPSAPEIPFSDEIPALTDALTGSLLPPPQWFPFTTPLTTWKKQSNLG